MECTRLLAAAERPVSVKKEVDEPKGKNPQIESEVQKTTRSCHPLPSEQLAHAALSVSRGLRARCVAPPQKEAAR
jgi:hypothetical protein